MTKDYQQQWKGIAKDTDKEKAVRVMAEILVSKEGRNAISRLEPKDAKSSIEILDRVSYDMCLPLSQLQTVRQGIMEHNLEPDERNAFFVALRRLAERNQLLPDRVGMKGKHEVSEVVHASGGFGDVRPQQYMGRCVAVKTAKVIGTDDVQKMKKMTGVRREKKLQEIQKTRKVSIGSVLAPTWGSLNRPPLEVLQGSRSLKHTIPSEHPETCRSSGGPRNRAICHRFRVDGSRHHHGVHRKVSCQ